MKTIVEKLYKYDELPEQSKPKACDQWTSSYSWEYEYEAICELKRVMNIIGERIGADYHYDHSSTFIRPGKFVYDLEDLQFRKIGDFNTWLDEMYELADMWDNVVDDLATINDELREHWRMFEEIEWNKGWNAASDWRANHPCRFIDERFWEIVGNLLKDMAKRADDYVYGFEDRYSCEDFVEEEIGNEKYSDVWFYPDGVMYEAHEAPAA